MTFSIVGFEPTTKELGIAVQSKILAVGAVVPWAKAGIGAVATQSYANPAYGPDGLAFMEQGKTPGETIENLLKEDKGRAYRQIGIMDANGETASFTGELCYEWAGSKTGTHYTAQGNMLVGKETIEALGKTFENSSGALADRLLGALEAGQKAGGDRRGKQSAVLYVVKTYGGYLGANDRYIDLRVDDHTDPITELQRIYQLHQLYYGVTKPADVLPLKGSVYTAVVTNLKRLGYLKSSKAGDEVLTNALKTFIHQENFENRDLRVGQIDMKVLNFLKDKPSPFVKDGL